MMIGMSKRIETLPDQIANGQPAGRIDVIVQDGCPVVDLVVSDEASTATVYLDWQMVASLMVALGSAASGIPSEA